MAQAGKSNGAAEAIAKRLGNDPLLTEAEVARFLRIGVDTVRTARRAGEIVGLRVRGRVRIRLSALEAYLSGAAVRAAGERGGGAA